jgi:hypothetical protein
LIAGCFSAPYVSVALTGGVLSSAFVHAAVASRLAAWPNKRLDVVPPMLPAAGGAVLLLALQGLGVPITSEIVENLSGCRALYARL